MQPDNTHGLMPAHADPARRLPSSTWGFIAQPWAFRRRDAPTLPLFLALKPLKYEIEIDS